MANEKQIILLVEDDELLAQTESLWLKHAGYDCIHVFSGKKAIEAVKNLILMDIDLKSGMDGAQTAEEILKEFSIPILFLTSHTEKEIVEKTEGITSYGYVVKDSSNTVLLTSIKMTLKLHKANQELLDQKKALRLSEEKFSKAFYTSPDAISISRIKDGIYLEINEGFTKLSGYTPEEIIGHSVKESNIGNWTNEEDYNNFIKKILDIGGLTNIETQFYLKDGSVGIGLLSANIIELEGEKCILLIMKDITDRKKIEEALKRNEERFKGIANNLPGVVFQFYAKRNGEFGLHYIGGDHTWETLGIENNPMETLFQRITECIAPEDRERFNESILESVQSFSKWDFVGKFIKPSGEKLYIHGLSLPRRVNDEMVFDGVLLDITSQKLTEESLKNISQLQKLILDNSTIGIAFVRNRIQVWVNTRFTEIFELPLHQIQGVSTRTFYANQEDYEKLEKEAYPLLSQGKNAQLEVEMRKGDGLSFWCRLEGKALDSTNPNDGSIWIFEDISERRLANQKILEAETRFRTLFELSPDGIVIIDPDTTKLFEFNETAHMQLGYSREEFSKLTVSDIDIDETSEETRLHVQQIMLMKHGEFETRHKTKQGEIRNIHVKAQIIEVLGRLVYYCIWRNITEQKKAELMIKESEANLKAMVENINESIWSVDTRYRYIDFNIIFANIVNKAFNVILKKGVGVLETLPEGIREFWRSKYDIALSGQRTRYEYSLKLDGELNYIEVYLNPIVTDDKITGVSAVGINITERKKIDTELDKYRMHLEELITERTRELENVNALLQEDNIKIKEAEEKVKCALAKEKELGELKSMFVYTASHEFRTPLTTILASTDLLEMYGRQWPETKYFEYIKIIQHTVKTMTELINDVLTYSKSETGKIECYPTLVDLHILILKLIDNAKLIASPNIHFNIVYKPEQISFFLDHKLVSQILTIFISNAIKYSPDGGNITLEVELKDKKLHISIIDEGIGIPDEDLGKLFEPFNRAQNIRTIPGSGLGLSIAKKSANIHNGEIRLKSILNKGTSVTLIIEAK